MPIRLVCPSCSAAITAKDKYAGRAVKCPKCGGVIPASEPASPARAKVDEPTKPSFPKAASRPKDKPVAKPAILHDPNEDEGDEPPRRSRRYRDDDADDAQGKSKTLLILGAVGCLLLVCAGIGGYWLFGRVKKEVAQADAEPALKPFLGNQLDEPKLKVGEEGFHRWLQVGITTRSEADKVFGNGQLATAADLEKVFPNADDMDKKNQWVEKVAQKRAVIWVHPAEVDFLLVAFHPNADSNSRVQLKALQSLGGRSFSEGEPDDAKFLATYPAGGLALTVAAETLVSDYKADKAAANAKYLNNVLTVEGKLISLGGVHNLVAELEVPPPLEGEKASTLVCTIRTDSIRDMYRISRGQNVTVRGKCTGYNEKHVFLVDCKYDSAGPETALTVSAMTLLDDYQDKDTGNQKYFNKELLVTDAKITRVEQGGLGDVYVAPTGKTMAKTKIRVERETFFTNEVRTYKVGDTVKIKGKCIGHGFEGGDDMLVFREAWFAP